MEKFAALAALAALAQESRLDIFRLLVEAGPAGLAAGRVAATLNLPPATLSFHLKELKQAGLIGVRRDGRSLVYAADFGCMAGLLAYLTDNCCGGNTDRCMPFGPTAPAEAESPGSSRRRA